MHGKLKTPCIPLCQRGKKGFDVQEAQNPLLRAASMTVPVAGEIICL